MTAPLRTSKTAARRFLLETQGLLSSSAPIADHSSVFDTIRRLECVQLDPVSVIGRNQHLVLHARLKDYKPDMLTDLLEEAQVFEYIANAACVIPMEDYPLLTPVRDRIRVQVEVPLEKVAAAAAHVLDRLKKEGPLPSRAFKSEQKVHGYWDNDVPKTKETSLALNLLLDGAFIRVVRRTGNERFFHLTEATVPENLLKTDDIQGKSMSQALTEKYMRAYRLIDPRDPRFGWQKMSSARRKSEIEERVLTGQMLKVEIDEVKQPYYILAGDAGQLEKSITAAETIEPQIRFLPPLDNLLWRRERIADLFDFEYKWEIYIPKAKRKYGAYVMPILYGDKLIGRIDPVLDRKAKTLTINLLELEEAVKPTKNLMKKIDRALHEFARFHHAEKLIYKASQKT